jgi:hypothetical protein
MRTPTRLKAGDHLKYAIHRCVVPRLIRRFPVALDVPDSAKNIMSISIEGDQDLRVVFHGEDTFIVPSLCRRYG